MKRFWLIVVACLAVAGLAAAQTSERPAPIDGRPKVEIKGKIDRIRITRGLGMPSLDVRTGDRIVNVTLGSMRYLLEQDFNPKAGDEVAVNGYRFDDSVVAISVTLSSTGKVLRLRDDAGRPLWMGGRRRATPAQ